MFLISQSNISHIPVVIASSKEGLEFTQNTLDVLTGAQPNVPLSPGFSNISQMIDNSGTSHLTSEVQPNASWSQTYVAQTAWAIGQLHKSQRLVDIDSNKTGPKDTAKNGYDTLDTVLGAQSSVPCSLNDHLEYVRDTSINMVCNIADGAQSNVQSNISHMPVVNASHAEGLDSPGIR